MFRRMTEQEIAIQKIANLRMVAVYEFTEAVRREENSPHGTDPGVDGFTAVTVLYGDNEQITMSELDPYFEELIGRLYEIYAETEDTSAVLMNEKTRELFESGRYTEEEHFQREFAKKQGSKIPAVSFAAFDSRRFLPLAAYVLESASAILGREATVVRQNPGWRGRGSIVLNSQNTDTLHPVGITCPCEGEYRIRIGDWPEPSDELRIDYTADDEGIRVAFAALRADFSGRFSYRFTADGAETFYEATHEGKPVYYGRDAIPAEPFSGVVDGTTAGLLPAGVPFAKAYRLPFDAVYVFAEETKRYRSVTKEDCCASLLFCGAGYSETMSRTKVDNRDSKVTLRKNSVRMKRARLRDGRYQTYFEPGIAGASGIYRTGLAGNYFVTE